MLTPDQDVGLESAAYPVTPGARYRLWVAVRVPEASVGSAYVAPIFLQSVETRRDIHPLTPQPIAVGSAATDPTGAWSLSTTTLESGRYRLLAEYAGDATYWPARARMELVVP
ncbi:MAG: Ig-like domain-containing protein [Chloroflexi bacterium]|nr:Ig-like domain-containing protein [Chloroflexota bacterium]